MEIAHNTHLLKNIFVNFYLIIADDGLTLIDTGISGNDKRIFGYLKNLGFKPENLQRIIITHADGDHFGSLAALQKVVSSQTFANQVEATAIRSGASSRPLRGSGLQKLAFSLVRPLVKSQPARIDQFLSPGQIFPVLGGLQVISTPGHTPGHSSLFSPSTGILFSGDSITVSGKQLAPSAGGNTWDLQQARSSYQLQVDLHPQMICAGHGFWKSQA